MTTKTGTALFDSDIIISLGLLTRSLNVLTEDRGRSRFVDCGRSKADDRWLSKLDDSRGRSKFTGLLGVLGQKF